MNETQRAAALRLADSKPDFCYSSLCDWADEAAALLRELAAELVPEPVAVTTKGHLAAMQNGYTRSVVARDPKFAAIGAMQDNDVPLYTNPPQQRKTLTDEQVYEAISDQVFWATSRNFILRLVRDVERAHGITGEPT